MLKPLALGACLALALSACATTPAHKDTTAEAARPPAGCVGNTATRLPVKDSTCAGFGQTYTQNDLINTGQPYADKSLKMLDPAIR